MPELVGATAWINEEVTRDDLVGKPTLVHFWSVSCGLCKEAIPSLNKLRDEFENELNVLAVHIPLSLGDWDLPIISSNAKNYHMTQPIFIDSGKKLSNAFGNKYMPAYYLFDKDGYLRHFQAGGSGMILLEQRIRRMINEVNRK